MSDIDLAMVMAAGLGKRMRPLTATRPKPLVTVAGKALIDHCFDRLAAGGIRTVVVNVHYLADSLEAHLEAASYPFEIRISDERETLLETGGGLVKALPLIDRDPFFSVNSDTLWVDGPRSIFDMLRSNWDDRRMDALLMLVPHVRTYNYRGPGDFHLDQRGMVTRRRPARLAPFVYSGTQLLSKRLLRDAPQGAFSTNILWDRAIEEGRLYGIVHEGLWLDVGTPQAIAPTEAVLTHG